MPDNVAHYLRKEILPNVGEGNLELVDATEVTEHTYVNWIYEATLTDKDSHQQTVYLRQTRDYVKTKPEIAVDAGRLEAEVRVLNILQAIVPGVVPRVLYFDKPNNAVVLSDIKGEGTLLIDTLKLGKPHPESGNYFGTTVATVHAHTLDINHSQVRGSQKANEEAINFHLGTRLKPALEAFPEGTEKLISDSRQATMCLVLGDLASKNIFVDRDKIRLLDFERAFVGDPAFDVAFLFCHYLLEVPTATIPQSINFIATFMQGYRSEMSKVLETPTLDRLANRIIRFLGVTVMYRLFGISTISDAEKNKKVWKELSGKLIISKASDVNEYLSAVVVSK